MGGQQQNDHGDHELTSYFHSVQSMHNQNSEEQINMQRKLGIKRSFHCDDLRSIVGLDQHHAQVQVQEDTPSNSSRKRVRRQRAISTDSTQPSCSALCYCCDHEEGKATSPLTANFIASVTSLAAASSDESTTPEGARLISPATSHVVVTPELAPAKPFDELGSLPCFPSLRTRNESSEFPATAALERYMLKQRPSLEDLEVDFSPSFEEETRSHHEDSYQGWPKLNSPHEEDSSFSPRQVDDFPWQARRVSMASRKSSSSSVSNSSSHGLGSQRAQSPFSFLKPHPSKGVLTRRQAPTVNQITEALARI